MRLTALAVVLRHAGLPVVEQPGWLTRGHSGGMDDVRGVTCHHTASGRATGPTVGLSTVQLGRGLDLPRGDKRRLDGPLAHLYLNREGVFHVVAAGLCWHAGASLKPGYTNAHRIGIEALAEGEGWSGDWPAAQMDAYARGCAALASHYGFPVTEVRGHKETCAPVGRKSDPSFSMPEFRRSVIRAGRPPIITQSQETDMDPNTTIPLSAAAARAMSAAPGATPRKEGERISVSYFLQWGGAGLAELRTETAGLAERIAKLEAEISALKAPGAP